MRDCKTENLPNFNVVAHLKNVHNWDFPDNFDFETTPLPHWPKKARNFFDFSAATGDFGNIKHSVENIVLEILMPAKKECPNKRHSD